MPRAPLLILFLHPPPGGQVWNRIVVEFLLGNHFRRVVVSAIPENNVSREIARTMYVDETPKQEVAIERAANVFRDRGTGRPTKKERRDIEKLRS